MLRSELLTICGGLVERSEKCSLCLQMAPKPGGFLWLLGNNTAQRNCCKIKILQMALGREVLKVRGNI